MTVVRPGEPRQPGRRVSLDAPAGTCARDVAHLLEGRRLVVEGRTVADTHPLGMPPLVHGALIQVDGRDARAPRRTESPPWELWVIEGPDLGLRYRLFPGRSVMGRSWEADVMVRDPRVSRRHAEIDVGPAGVRVRDVGGANGTWLGATALTHDWSVLGVDETLRLGRSGVVLRPRPRGWPVARPDGAGRLMVARGGSAGSGWAEREAGRSEGGTGDERAGRGEGGNVRAADTSCSGLGGAGAGPGRTGAGPGTTGPGPGGTGPGTGEIRFPDPPQPAPRSRFPLVALVVPLLLAGLLALVMRSPTMVLFGLTGPVLSLASWLGDRRSRRRGRDCGHTAAVAQAQAELAAELVRERAEVEAAHPPLAAILALAESRTAGLWARPFGEVRVGAGRRRARIRLLGGTRPAQPMHEDAPVTVDLTAVRVLGIHGARPDVVGVAAGVLARLCTTHPPSEVEIHLLVGSEAHASDWSFACLLPHVRGMAVSSGGSGSDVVERLLAEIGRREDGGRVDPRRGGRPRLVVLIDGWPQVGGTPGAIDLVRRGSAVGVVVICLDRDRSLLPPHCQAVLSLDRERAHLTDAGVDVDVVPDRPGPFWLDRVSRALAPLRDVHLSDVGGRLPDEVRLVDLLGHEPDRALVERWSRRAGSTQVVLGASATGPLTLDLSADGPHALVAGTTGAGKSELLQTLVCSLALANRPDELVLILVDYKGGTAFRGCAGLPHVVGFVTDLDLHLTARALTSLGAELRRRERLLAAAGCADLHGYRRRRAHDPSLPVMPRLVIVIDEFRVLAEELQDFVQGLVRLAAVGRSLGVHLVLATQRPGGIVSAEIRANVSLRIALRVRGRADSVDVLEAPDAADIGADVPGRAVLRGALTPLTRFQTARVTCGSAAPSVLTVTEVGDWWKADQARNPSRRPGPSGPSGPSETRGEAVEAGGPTDLDRIVAATTAAALRLGIPGQPSPWLTPLPDLVPAHTLTAPPGAAAVGLEDDPHAQRQSPWCWSPAEGGLGLAGGSGSGRTTALLTVATGIARACPPTELHLYAVGPAALQGLAALPHTAAVARLDDPEHLRLVLDRLREVVRGRPSPGARVVVLVDGWEQLAALSHGAVAADLRTLLDSGGEYGVRAVITGGRAVLAGQLVGLFGRRLVLPVQDPVDLALAGIPGRVVTHDAPPGRALDVRTHKEVQVAVVDDLPSSVEDIRRQWVDLAGDLRAPQAVRQLPERVLLDDLVTTDRELVTVGVREGDLAVMGFAPPRGERRIVVIGPAGSGRTITLTTLAAGFVAAGHPVCLVGADLHRNHLEEGPHATTVVLSVDGRAEDDRDRLIETRRRHPELVVLVDDAERLSGLPIEAVLREIARRADEDRGVIVVATGSATLDGRTIGGSAALVADLAGRRTGLVLAPQPGAYLLGTSMPATARPSPDPAAAHHPPGRGILVTATGLTWVQVATVSRP